MENVLKPLTKSVWTPLVLTAAASAADTGRHKKKIGSWMTNNFKQRKGWYQRIFNSLEDAG